ncbi:aminotransferase class I/II-fold pyridoxal phosphate-dependent enzyme [Sphingobacterium olei]|uniref:Aminotransferase class I/II-fold pyridoxal phosphate-dependent enzyme n=1 Tax=Sphingobacterium olei TaxID=2571155 RepID=A0A4U0P452_9SPHI|nr:aminotransferase class I/II-fold pyridoxal phosphate-dependent enzyme [Sphingobacterium olei]TJZ62019.1 aminotransferase class I/II-fold pyridoxal phosphate-dependent enzyme [Sphingobacterium olei]
MNISLKEHSFKTFENPQGSSFHERMLMHQQFLNYLGKTEAMNYRLEIASACHSEVVLRGGNHIEQGNYISFVCNDYLGFTQHPKVKAHVIQQIDKYGVGSGASPLIGGYYSFHRELEEKLCRFFNRSTGSALAFTTGFTANSASLLALLKKEDIAIVDMAVHSSVYEGLMGTNTKRFMHNNLESLELALKLSKDKYRTKMVIIDGVYSQDGDIAPLSEIYALCKMYGALLMMDDAHGIGVFGRTGRGIAENHELLEKIDIISGTFSKSLANVGGFVIAQPEVIQYLQFQSRQYAFSAAATPAITGVVKCLELIDEEPQWRDQLWANIRYFKNGLTSLGFNIGNTESAIIPVKIGAPEQTCKVGSELLKMGVYTNPIMYPAVSMKDCRIRMSVLATHTKEQLDKTLNSFDMLKQKFNISLTHD